MSSIGDHGASPGEVAGHCTAVEGFDAIRAAFPITETRAYLFAGGMAPLCTPAREALDSWSELCSRDPIVAYREYPTVESARLRRRVAGFIGTEPEGIALVDSTSRGNNIAVELLHAPRGSNVVIDDTTYPSALFPWLLPSKRHVEIRRVPGKRGIPQVEAFETLVDDRTVAISVSHVCRITGFRHDLGWLAKLAHAHSAAVLVDGAQSVGALCIDVEADEVDFLSFGAMKWLLGTPGVGFLFVRSDYKELWPPQAGQSGAFLERENGTDKLKFVSGAARHDLSSMHWGGLWASRQAADLLASVALANVESRVLHLSGQLIEGLKARGIEVYTPSYPLQRAGVVAFASDQPNALRLYLRELGVDVWAWEWEGRSLVRADPHVYNTIGDIDRFFAGIDSFGAKPREYR